MTRLAHTTSPRRRLKTCFATLLSNMILVPPQSSWKASNAWSAKTITELSKIEKTRRLCTESGYKLSSGNPVLLDRVNNQIYWQPQHSQERMRNKKLMSRHKRIHKSVQGTIALSDIQASISRKPILLIKLSIYNT